MPSPAYDAHLDISWNSPQAAASGVISTAAGVVVYVFVNFPSISFSVTGVTGGGLSWARRTSHSANGMTSELWWAYSAGSLSSATITANFSGSVASGTMLIISFTGAASSAPFDNNTSVPAVATGPSGTPIVRGLTTTMLNDDLVYFLGTISLPGFVAPTGFTRRAGSTAAAPNYDCGDRPVSSGQLASTIIYPEAMGSGWILIVDALTADAAVPTANLRASQSVEAVLGFESVAFSRVSQIVASVLCLNVPAPPTFVCPIPLFPDIQVVVGNSSVVQSRGWSVKRKQTYASLIQTVFSGRESIMYQQQYGLWEFELTYPFLRDQTQNQVSYAPYSAKKEFEAVSRLFNWASATRGSFYFEDPSDNSRLAQPIGTGNGIDVTFPVLRTINVSGNPTALIEPVGAVNLARPNVVYFNGVAQSSSSYSISGNLIMFSSAPALGVIITMDFWFYYLCRFIEDQHKYSEFMKNLWEFGKCRFRSLLVPC